MRGELDSRRLPARVKGRWAIEQKIVRVLLTTHRYGQHRARTLDELAWTARVLDRLQEALQEARR